MTDPTQQQHESPWQHIRDAFASLGRFLHILEQEAPAIADAVAAADPTPRTIAAAKAVSAAQKLLSLAQSGAADHPDVVDAVAAVHTAEAVAVAAGAPAVAAQIDKAEPVAVAVDAVQAAALAAED